MTKLTAYEREILEEAAGERPTRAWGAAVGAALEFLREHGYIDSQLKPTDKGRAELRDDPLEDEQRRREAQEHYDSIVKGPRRDDP